MAHDFTTFTEVDPNSHVTRDSATQISLNGLTRDETAYVYKDMGANYYDGNFSFNVDFRTGSASASGYIGPYIWGLGNALNSIRLLTDSLGVYLFRSPDTSPADNYILAVYERDNGTEYSSNVFATNYDLAENTTYYVTVWRDESVGTYGTIYLKLFTDAARTAQLGNTASIALHTSKKDYRYLYALSSRNVSAGQTWSYVGNIYNLVEGTRAAITFTEDDDVVAIVGGFATGTITFTEADDVVAIVANLDIPTGSIIFTEDNDVVTITGAIKNIATISFTEDNDVVSISVGIPSTGYISIIEESDTVSILMTASAVTEPFSVRVRHKTTGAPITGLTTVLLSIRQPVTGYRWDFSDNSFKTTPTTPTLVLTEVSAANQPGLYESLVTTTSWSGWVEFEANYNDGSYTYTYPGEAYYTNGVRANGSWSVVEWASINVLPTLAEVESSTVLAKQAKLDFVEKWILNKLVESPTGDTVTLYDDDGVTPLKTWAWNNTTKTRSIAI